MMRRVRNALAAIALGAVALASEGRLATPARADAQAPLAIEDFRTSVSIGDVAASPHGNAVAFVTREGDYDRDAIVSKVRVVDADSGNVTTITRNADNANSPRWSPDGKSLAFLAKPGSDAAKPPADPSKPASEDPALGAPQIAVVSPASVVPRFVTHEKRGVQSFAWSPDGKRFAYLTQDEAPNQKAIDAHDDAFEVHDNQWTLQSAPVPTHLWTISASGGPAHRVTQGPFSLSGDVVFAPDGRSVLVTRYPWAYTQHYLAQRLVRVQLSDGSAVPIVASAPADGPIFSRDGARLAYATENPASFSIQDAVVAKADGSKAVDVTRAFDRAVQSARFARDGSLVVEVPDGARSRLAVVRGSHAVRLDLGELNPGAFDVDANDRIVFAASSPVTPQELYAVVPGGRPRRLTSLNAALLKHAIAPTVPVEWKGAGGFTDDGVVTLPLGVDPGAKAPLVLVIHGGPTASSTTSFSEIPQLLAAHGFYVFQPNYRGSDNLGAAFAQATVPHITSAPGQDVEDGLAAVLAHYPIDAARIGVSGWSEGGLLTSWLITHDTRWKTAMSGAGVDDWLMYHDLTDAQDFTYGFMSKTMPWTDPTVRELYRAESPLTYADRVKTPTLIMTDAGDQRVPEPISFAFYHAIRAAGTPVTMVVIPVDGHFPSDPVRSEDVIRRWVDWFGTNL